MKSNYKIHPDLRAQASFQLPEFTMKPLGAMVVNTLTGIGRLLYEPPLWVKCTRMKIPVASTIKAGKIGITIFEPLAGYQSSLNPIVGNGSSSDSKKPALVYFPGGGFALAATTGGYNLAAHYAKEVGCKVVFVEYRLSSRYAFPVPVEDCYQALMWVFSNAKQLGIDPSRIAVGGDSAGGALAAAVTQMFRDRGKAANTRAAKTRSANTSVTDAKAKNKFQIIYQLLIYPVTDMRMQTDSMKQYTDTPIWHAGLTQKMWDLYLKKDRLTDENRQYASPILAEDFSNLPNAYIEVAEFDCLRDEGLDYGARLKKGGSLVDSHQVMGGFHGFDMVTDKPMVKEALELRVKALKNAFLKKR